MSAGGPAEFDRFARDYGAGFDDPLKRLVGPDARAFLRPKLDLLRRAAARRPGGANAPLAFLDFGCGSGDFLALIAEAGLPWQLEGCEVSAGMLAEADRRWPTLAARSRRWLVGTGPFPEDRYDLISAVCVLHHVPPAEWADTLARLGRALRPGGILCLFEHNPWNPVTRWMVSRTEIDADAHLLSPRTGRRLMEAAGLAAVRVRHFLFVPPSWPGARAVDRMLGWWPLGGQYLALGERRDSDCAAPDARVT